MQAGAAELLRLVSIEDAVREIRPEIEPTAKTAQQFDLLGNRLRLETDPRHPRPQVLDARIDGLLEEWRVARVVAADDEAVGLDPVRRGRGYSHSIVAGGFEVTSSTTRFTAGISLMIREETSSIRSYGSRAQSAVIASSEVTARIAIG